MGLVYFYAGVAKLNGDWLRGWPLRLWLPPESDFPVIGRFFTEEWCQLLFSYGGLGLDLFGAFLLLWRPTRPFVFVVFLLFHLTNSRLFGIGIFPWFAIATTLLFFEPDWPRRIFNYPRRMAAASAAALRPSPLARRAVIAGLALYLGIQVLVPLRHFAYPGNVSWTEEGHEFAWHMKLRDKEASANFRVTDPVTGRRREVDENQYLTRRQRRKMAARPDLILQFAHFLAQEFAVGGRPAIVQADVRVSLNGRREQPLVDPEANLAEFAEGFAPKTWLVPLREPLRGAR